MKRTLRLFMILACVGVIGSSFVMAEPVTRGFGFGGPMALAFFPDMTGINTFMSENGLPPMCDVLIGAGGGGRGGVIGGPSFGGIGWGVLATSESEELHAELVFAGGGFDLGAAIGGDESSVLTVGAVLGGGANVLSITGYLVETIEPEGLVPEPTHRELVRALGFVQPYVSMSAQLLPWMGFEFRIGYVFPVFGIDVGDDLGILAPSLDLSGPTVSFGFAFGGIGSGADRDKEESTGHEQVTSTSEGTLVVDAEDEFVIENAFGSIVISGYEVVATEPASDLVVEWQVVKTASERRIDELHVLSDVTDTGASLKTVGDGQVDYIVRVPLGIDLKVKNGAGEISLNSYEAQTIIIENGAGDMSLQGVQAIALIVAGGVGKIDLLDVDAQMLIVDLGIGEIALELPMSVSATVTAKAGLGEVSIDRFPSMIGGVSGFLGQSGNVTLGNGERTVELNVKLGEIDIKMQEP